MGRTQKSNINRNRTHSDDAMANLFKEASGIFPYTQSIRREIHRYPELGFEEYKTSQLVERDLILEGLEVHSGIGKTGLTGFINGEVQDPIIAIRFEMDALPIQEENEIIYASTRPGIMHACGHDGHVAAGLATVKILNKYRHLLKGSVQFIFQPAEEGLGGARKMIEEGVFLRGKPKYCMAFHLWNDKPVGYFGIAPGPFMASSDSFEITIQGKGGHGAIPHEAVDPIIAAAQLITASQSIISRNISPMDGAVLSFGQVSCGETYSVIPDKAMVKGTIRTFSQTVRAEIINRLGAICNGLSLAFNCTISLQIKKTTPAVVNDYELAKIISGAIQEAMGDAIIENTCQTMVSDDFTYYSEEAPGCLVLVGSKNPGSGENWGHHHPRFDFDERAMTYASTLLSSTVLKLNELQ